MKYFTLLFIYFISSNAFEIEFQELSEKIDKAANQNKKTRHIGKIKFITKKKNIDYGYTKKKAITPNYKNNLKIVLENNMRYNPYEVSQRLAAGLKDKNEVNKDLFRFIDLSNPGKISHIIYK